LDHGKKNPWLGLATDRASAEQQVDAFIAQFCASMGHTAYITSGEGGPPPPLPLRPPSLGSRLGNLVAGAEANVEFLKSSKEAVPPALSESRAGICVTCPLNSKGGLERFFTVPIASAIRRAYSILNGWNLKTSHDADLGVCEACDCPMKLKVHFPITLVREKLTDSAKAALWEKCWIRHE
jgi:hypothetical protein